MSNLVIVAIPTENDPVWKLSSEKKPHLTMLFLGDSDNPQKNQIAQFLIHAVNLCLTRFSLDVDRRGELGDDKADVLFFEDDIWDLPDLKEFRAQLLQYDPIRTAYDSAEQFSGWTPHLTLGYPKTPAKDNAIDYPVTYITFDRIALWDGNYEGIEIILKKQRYDMEVAMSTVDTSGKGVVENLLAHYGVRGMKWGVRKDRTATPVAVKTNPTKRKTKAKIKTTGGKNLPPHPQAIEAAVSSRKVKKSGTAALSNDELRSLANRLSLEQQVSNLTPKSGAKRFVAKLLVDTGKQQAQRVVNQKATEQVDNMLARERG